MRNITLVLILSCCLFGCQEESRRIQNIETFAKIYGYARWFHPSDEAQEIDWDKFAVLGVKKVEGAKSDTELKDTLISLFLPIAQGLQIYETGKQFDADIDALTPPNVSDNKMISWQHYGVKLSERSSIYKSIRTNRPKNNSYSLINKWVFDISSLKGKEVKLSGYFKTEQTGSKGKAYLYLLPVQMNEVANSVSSIISKNSIEINATDWKKYEITSKINDNTSYVVLGCAVDNDINVWADIFELNVKNNDIWEKVNLPNSGFESTEMDNDLSKWQFDETMHNIEVSDIKPYSGKYSVYVEFMGKMFENTPEFGEVIDEPLGSNLSCIIPLTLYEKDSSTFPVTEFEKLEKLQAEISDILIPTNFDRHTNLASVIIAWNVFQHFYPYFDVVDTNWEEVLPQTLEKACADVDKKDFTKTLRYMVAELEDGHGVVYGERMYHLPIRTEWIENRVVITASNESILKVGDIITKVNGIDAEKVQLDMESLISGSPQLKRYRALNVFGSTFQSEIIQLMLERKGKQLDVDIRNISDNKSIFFNSINDLDCNLERILEIEPDIFYVNLKNCSSEDITNRIEDLAKANSVIYDFRWGAKFMLTDLIPYLIDTPVNSAWMDVPEIIYPNQKDVTFDKNYWSLEPKSPHFTSKTIILNSPSVVSSGETSMGILDHYNLATTVGEPTAGCNGNVNWLQLPSGYQIMWTGMKVLKHDGSQLHLIGFEPDYQVNRTLNGVMEWEDEVLEKALEIARK